MLTSVEHFCKVIVRRDIRSVIDIMEVGGSWR
jgi:hypothetical protein